MSDICEWFTQYIDLAEDVVIIKFSDGTTKTVKRGIYLKEVEDNIRKMLIDQVKTTGHWIAYQNKQVCSECGNAKPLGVATYCRGCGAKMQ